MSLFTSFLTLLLCIHFFFLNKVWFSVTSPQILSSYFVVKFPPVSALSPSHSSTNASSWISPPLPSVWLTRRASMTWRSSPSAPSDRTAKLPTITIASLSFSLFFFFFCTSDLPAFSVPIKSDTQLRYKLFVPVVLSRSLVCSSAHWMRTAFWLCTLHLYSVRGHVGNVHLLTLLVHVY